MADHKSTTPLSERDSWSTPDYIFEWLDNIFGFDVDLAASDSNHKTPYYLDIDNDALEHDWHFFGDTGFLNPPYSSIKPWVARAVKEQAKGFITVMLIPTPNGESYYKDIFENASEIIYINGRVAFIGANGKPKSGNTRGSCVVVFGRLKGNPKLIHIDRDELINRVKA